MNSIYAIIVTYNRKDLLAFCLDCVSQQTKPPSNIIVVDNASTDGTSKFLESTQKKYAIPVTVLHLPTNVGGAGGFRAGIKHAIQLQASEVWLMDDDGFPSQNCLELLSCAKKIYGWRSASPIQVQIDKPDILSFPVPLGPNHPVATTTKDSQKHTLISGFANLFNGMLADCDLFEEIGLPNPDYFIRGDEEDILYKLQRAAIPFGTYTIAIFYHPTDHHERHLICNGIIHIRDSDHPFKNYYLYRNKIKLLRLRGKSWKLAIEFVKYSLYYFVYKRFDLKGYSLWLKATFDGVLNKKGASY